MPPRKQRNRDQHPELLRLVDQQSEQSAGEQRPVARSGSSRRRTAGLDIIRRFDEPRLLRADAERFRQRRSLKGYFEIAIASRILSFSVSIVVRILADAPSNPAMRTAR